VPLAGSRRIGRLDSDRERQVERRPVGSATDFYYDRRELRRRCVLGSTWTRR